MDASEKEKRKDRKSGSTERANDDLPALPPAEMREVIPAVEILQQFVFIDPANDEHEEFWGHFFWQLVTEVRRDYLAASVQVENNRIEDRKKRQILRRLRSALHSANEIVRSLDADRRLWRPSEDADSMTDAEIRESFQNDAMKAWYNADLMSQCALISMKRSVRRASYPAKEEALRRLSDRLDRLATNRNIPHSDRLKIERAIIRAARLPDWQDAPPPDGATDQRFAIQAHRRRKTAR